jgi:hypothetical protein
MTRADDLTRMSNVLGSLGGGVDPTVKMLETQTRELEELREKFAELTVMMMSRFETKGSEIRASLATVVAQNQERKRVGQSVEYATKWFEAAVDIP